MTVDKLKMHSPDLTQSNIDAIAELFPTVVTETVDSNGNPARAVNFDALRQELSDHVVEGPQERYQLDWPGKRAAAFAANMPIAKTLRPAREESVDFDTTKNLFIEGDNLDALKLLQESYLGKVKLIYIDPPYNTGNDFVYEDDFAESSPEYLERSGQTSGAGERLVANPESKGRFHSDWLSMMYPRLKLARSLLSDDGVIFMSIDDNEAANLRRLGDEIFGAQNFVTQIAVQVNPRGRHLDRFIAKTHESILVFVRDASTDAIEGVAKEGRMAEEYQRSDDRGPYRLLGLRNRNQAFNPNTRPNLYYPLYVSESDGRVSATRDSRFVAEVHPDAPDGTQTCWTWGRQRVAADNDLLTAERAGDEWRVFRKDYLYGADGETAKTLVKSAWLDPEFSNDYGRKAVKEQFNAPVMDFPKSPFLIKRLIEIGARKDSIVLDFFAGSATTAHAVMMANAKDGGHRRFIMIQLAEQCTPKSEAARAGYATVSELARERVRRSGAAVRKTAGLMADGLDTGFRALSIDTSGFAQVLRSPDEIEQLDLGLFTESLKADRTGSDLLFQVMLDWGLDLSMPIARTEVTDREIFTIDSDALVACFADEVTDAVVRELANRHPLRAVFRDSGFATDAARINAEQIFREVSPETDVRAI